MEKHKKDLVSWLNFVDCSEIKSFVELTIAPSVRQGAQNLILVSCHYTWFLESIEIEDHCFFVFYFYILVFPQTSGLGSMRANTVVLGRSVLMY